MKSIGIKLADGSFYPIMQEGSAQIKDIELTTVQDNQTIVHVDLYRSETGTMEDAQYVDTLEIKDLNPHQNGEASLNLQIGLDENNELKASIVDNETGTTSETNVSLVNKTLSEALFSPQNIDFDSDPTLSEQNQNPNEAEEQNFENEIEEPSIDDVEETVSLTDDEIKISDADLVDAGLADLAQNDFETSQVNEEEYMIGPSVNDEEFSFDEVNTTATESSGFIADDNAENTVDSLSLNDDIPLDDISLPDFGDDEAASENIADETLDTSEDSAADFTDETNDDLTMPDFGGDENSTSDDLSLPQDDDLNADGEIIEESVEDSALPDFDDEASDDSQNLPEENSFAEDEISVPVDNETALGDTDISTDETNDDLSLPDFGDDEAASENIADEPLDTSEDSAADFTDETNDDLSLPDFGDDEAASENIADEPLDTSEDSAADFTDETNDDLSLPDFGDDENSISDDLGFTQSDDLNSSGDETDDAIVSNDDDFSLPDFGDDLPLNDDSLEPNISEEPVGISSVFDDKTDFGEVDLSTDSNGIADDFDSSFDESLASKDPTPAPQNTMFKDIYDDTEIIDEEKNKSKTKISVIICIVCAIICIIATLLVLFVIPSKLNLASKNKKSKEKVEKLVVKEVTPENPLDNPADDPLYYEPEIADLPVEEPVKNEEPIAKEEPPEIKEEPVLEAVEDEIVVAPAPEKIVPEPVAPNPKAKDTKYKIVWGDTLWDISTAYYKNPWKYKKIAEHNKIKNPDKIVSGTWINIPAE